MGKPPILGVLYTVDAKNDENAEKRPSFHFLHQGVPKWAKNTPKKGPFAATVYILEFWRKTLFLPKMAILGRAFGAQLAQKPPKIPFSILLAMVKTPKNGIFGDFGPTAYQNPGNAPPKGALHTPFPEKARFCAFRRRFSRDFGTQLAQNRRKYHFWGFCHSQKCRKWYFWVFLRQLCTKWYPKIAIFGKNGVFRQNSKMYTVAAKGPFLGCFSLILVLPGAKSENLAVFSAFSSFLRQLCTKHPKLGVFPILRGFPLLIEAQNPKLDVKYPFWVFSPI